MQAFSAPVTKRKQKLHYTKAVDEKGKPIFRLWKSPGAYYAQLGPRGHSVKLRMLATNVADAKIELEEMLADREKYGDVGVGGKRTIAQLGDEYLAEKRQSIKEKTARTYELIFKKASKFFGKMDVRRMKPCDLAKWRTALLETMGPRSVALQSGIVGSLLEWAYKRDIIRSNPVDKLDTVKYKELKKPLLTDEEISRLYASARKFGYKELITFCEFVRLTGARRSEAVAVRWVDVSDDNSRVVIGALTSKNGYSRIVHSSRALMDLLAGMKRGEPSAPIFSKTLYTLCDQLNRCKSDAGLMIAPGIWGFHLFRHLFASKSIQAGVDVATVAGWLGHRDGGKLLLKTYSHLTDTHSKQMAEKLNFGTFDVAIPSVPASVESTNNSPAQAI